MKTLSIGPVVLCALAPLLAARPVAMAGSAPEVARLPVAAVVQRMQKRYEQAADFRAHFSQSLTNPTFGRTTVSSGDLIVKKPGKMRWDYDKPEKKMYLATDQILWMYEPEEKQAVKSDLKASQLPATLSFLTGRGKLADEFEITLARDIPFGGPTDYKLSLKPRKPQSTYRFIYFLVDPETFFVKQSVLIDTQGVVNAITFSAVLVNSKVPDATFKWAPPAGVRVIDPSKPSR